METAISKYQTMRVLEFDGKIYVDKDIFKDYVVLLLQQELIKNELTLGEQIGVEVAIGIISNIS